MADQAKKKASDALSKYVDWLSDLRRREHPTAGGYGTGTAGNAHITHAKRLEEAKEKLRLDVRGGEYVKGLKQANDEMSASIADSLHRRRKLSDAKDATYNDNYFNESHPDLEGRRSMLDKGMAAADARIANAEAERAKKHTALNKGYLPDVEKADKLRSKADKLNKEGGWLNAEQVKKIAGDLKNAKPIGSATADRILDEGADHARLQSRKEGTIAATTILGAGAAGGAGAAYRSSWSQKKDAERK